MFDPTIMVFIICTGGEKKIRKIRTAFSNLSYNPNEPKTRMADFTFVSKCMPLIQATVAD
jgi:hypothetical protein